MLSFVVRVHSSFANILIEEIELVVLLTSLSAWLLVNIVWFFHAVLWVCLQFVTCHTLLLFFRP